MKKYRTEKQTETAQARAVRFAENVLEDSDLADELESLTPEEYADRKVITITNPGRRTTQVANGNGGNNSMTKDEMADCLGQVEDILTDAYTPEASREDLAAAIGDALDVIQGNAPPDDGDVDDDDDAGN